MAWWGIPIGLTLVMTSVLDAPTRPGPGDQGAACTTGCQAQSAADLAADPFAQFDLGVAVIDRNGTVPGWIPLAESGLRLRAESAIVAPGDTIDALLLRRRIRPDPYARSLVALLNPGLDESLTLAAGQAITLFHAEDAAGSIGPDRFLALQPFRSERARLEDAIEEFELWTALSNRERRLTRQVVSLQQEALLTDLAQVRQAGAILERFSADVGQVNDARIRAVEASTEIPASAVVSSVQAATHAARLELRANASSSAGGSLVVRAAVPTSALAAQEYCEVGWSVAGFSTFPNSRRFEAYREPTPVSVPASDLDVWIARNRETPPTESLRRVGKDQLISGDPHLLSIPVAHGCRS